MDIAIPHFTDWCMATGEELRKQGHDIDDTGLLSLYLKTFPGRTAALIEELLDYRNKHLAGDVDAHIEEHRRALEMNDPT